MYGKMGNGIQKTPQNLFGLNLAINLEEKGA